MDHCQYCRRCKQSSEKDSKCRSKPRREIIFKPTRTLKQVSSAMFWPIHQPSSSFKMGHRTSVAKQSSSNMSLRGSSCGRCRLSFTNKQAPALALLFLALLTIVVCLTISLAGLLPAKGLFGSVVVVQASELEGVPNEVQTQHQHQHQFHKHRHQQHKHNQPTTPANLQQSREFNNFRHDQQRDFDPYPRLTRRQEKDEISTSLQPQLEHNHKSHIHNHNLEKPGKSQQVPEQLPIVVSLSDNSYVSASPVEPISTTTTTHTLANEHINSYRNRNRNRNKNKKHRTRYQLHNPISSNSFSQSQSSNLSPTKDNTRNKQHYRELFRQKLSRINLLNSRKKEIVGESGGEHENDQSQLKTREENSIEPHQHLTSSSDISTTATTTQRNKGKYKGNNLVQYSQLEEDTSNIDDQDLDILSNNEANIHEGVDAQYHIKSAAIIKTRESIELGASFINYTIVTNLNACLVECWITDSCDTAIYQESPVDFNNNNNNNIINHLPDLFTDSKEHNSLKSLKAQSQITQSFDANDKTKSFFKFDDDNNFHDLIDAKFDNRNDDDDDDDDDDEDDNDIDIAEEIVDDNTNTKNNNNNRSKSSQLSHFTTETFPDNGFYICYLFQCAKPDGFKCQFSAHNYYVSATKRYLHSHKPFTIVPHAKPIEPSTAIDVNLIVEPFVTNNISDTSFNHHTTTRLSTSPTGELETTTQVMAPQDYYCEENQFRCMNQNQCISNYYKCDGITQCSDESDELECGSEASSNSGKSSMKPTDSGESSQPLDRYNVVMGDESMIAEHLIESTNSPLKSINSNEGSSGQVPQALHQHNYVLIEENNNKIKEETNVILKKSDLNNELKSHYSNIVAGQTNHHPFNNIKPWRDSHIASIRMSQEEYDYDYEGRSGGMNSAIIAIMFGIGATGMLVVIVGHKMKSIRKRIAYRGRRRSLVPDVDFLINTIPM